MKRPRKGSTLPVPIINSLRADLIQKKRSEEFENSDLGVLISELKNLQIEGVLQPDFEIIYKVAKGHSGSEIDELMETAEMRYMIRQTPIRILNINKMITMVELEDAAMKCDEIKVKFNHCYKIIYNFYKKLLLKMTKLLPTQEEELIKKIEEARKVNPVHPSKALLETKPLEGDAEDVIDEPAAEHQMPTDIENKVNSIMASEETINIIDKMTANHFGFESLHDFIKSEPTDETLKECADYFAEMTNMVKTQIEGLVKKESTTPTKEALEEEPECLTESKDEFANYLKTNALRTAEMPFLPINLLNFIYGDNPTGRIYYNTDPLSLTELINYVNYPGNREFLSNPDIPIEKKMEYMFGEDWNKEPEKIEPDPKKISAFMDEFKLKRNKHIVDIIETYNRTHNTDGTLLSTLPEYKIPFADALSLDRFNKLANVPSEKITAPAYDPNRVLGPNSQLTPECDIPPIVPNTETEYEMVNHPSHYNTSSVETIEKMRRIWGNQATALWCEMTAFKYRERIGLKPDNSLEQEMGKIKWYEDKAKELRSK